MRLLFIYFYKPKGTFKEGTIVELSKKYSVEHLGKFKFKLTKRDSFQDDFYGENIDIGAIIGENGTGKSVLINSLRDGNNDYSLAVYEKGDGEFFYEGNFDGEISFEDKDINSLDDTSFVYYSPIMDIFDFEKDDLVNVSDKNILLENTMPSLKDSFIKIENEDIHKYLSLEIQVKNNIEIEQLKLIPYQGFFDYAEKEIKKNGSLYMYMQKATEEDEQLYKIFIEKINSILKIDMKNIILNKKLNSLDKIFLNKNHSLLDSYIQVLEIHHTNIYDKGGYHNEHLREIFETFLSTNDFQDNYDFNKIYENIMKFLSIYDESEYEKDDDISMQSERLMAYLLEIYLENVELESDKVETIKFFKNHIGLTLSIEELKLPEEEINEIMKTLDIRYIDSCIQENFNDSYLSQFNVSLFEIEEINKFTNYLFEDLLELDFHTYSLLFICLFRDKEYDDYQQLQVYTLLTLLISLNTSIYFPNLNYLLELSFQDMIDVISLELEEKNQVLYKKFIEKLSIDCLLEVDDIYIEIYNILKKQFLVPLTYELDPPLSSGQKAILFIFARIDNAIKQIKSKNITILLDEADLKLHLEWQRQFINDLVDFLKSYPDKKFYVLYATHSPMILSDITDDRIVFLKKEGEYSIDKSINEKKSTFGANIYDLYHDSFFMDKYMGEFAFNKINDVINMVNLYKIVDELNDDKEKENLKDYERIYNFDELFKSYVLYYPNEEIDSKKLYVKREDIKANIENKKEVLIAITKFIGEPLLRNKLEDDLNSMGREFNIDKVVEKLQGLSQKEIKEELSKYSESIQMKILKKLFASENNYDKG